MARKQINILGVDTSLRSTGVGIILSDGVTHRGLVHGTIRNPKTRCHSQCLDHLYTEISALIEKHRPEVAAVEGVFHCRNVKTAIILGQARGVVLAACAKHGLPVFEYAPRSVKKSVVGRGSAPKEQVVQMVRASLGLKEDPEHDAADALAIAMSHAQQMRLSDVMNKESI